MAIQEVVAEYKYPEYDTYKGPAYRGVINFRSLKGSKLLIDYIMKNLIVAKCKIADVTPLRAVLKRSQIKEDFLDYVADEYELILYYHESPAVASIIYAIAIAIAALGFLVIAWKTSTTVWETTAKTGKGIVELPSTIAESTKSLTYSLVIVAALYFVYISTQKGE